MMLPLTTKPMEADPVDDLPTGPGWQYEPKYDGFRCLTFAEQAQVHLRSKNGKALGRYFPELVEALLGVQESQFALDGEIISPGGFEALQLRLHPAASRVRQLSAEQPAQLVVFDLLARHGTSLLDRPLNQRRLELESFMKTVGKSSVLKLGKKAATAATARKWIGEAGLDGVMAKRTDLPYQPGKRAMRKYKLWKTVDCVVGGLYLKSGTRRLDSLLLGLHDDEGLLHYVGRARVPAGGQEMVSLFEEIEGGAGFTGRRPGRKDRWSGAQRDYVPLEPVVVAEVSTDHVTDDFMRHGARLLHFRQDKDPQDCLIDQIR